VLLLPREYAVLDPRKPQETRTDKKVSLVDGMHSLSLMVCLTASCCTDCPLAVHDTGLSLPAFARVAVLAVPTKCTRS